MAITRQNITERLYQCSLINNTDVQTSAALTELVLGVTDNTYATAGDVVTALSNGDITNDTYIVYTPENVVDTAKRIVEIYY